MPEYDVHGMRPSEIDIAVDRILCDMASRREVCARIIHGIGTGALRSAVDVALKKHPMVKRVEVSFDGGSTEVWIAVSAQYL
jgi:dsDNA-specific endonuclease/ATPase MutS2